MGETEASRAIAAVHARLVESLRDLELSGEYAVAAHLAAAIDVLEDRIDLTAEPRTTGHAASPVSTLARTMTERFGARAETVARRQLEHASGPALVAWAAIISRMAD